MDRISRIFFHFIILCIIFSPLKVLGNTINPADTNLVIITPGEEYNVGSFRRFLFGSQWRDLWATPISIPVLDLRKYAGGLTPIEKGGGQQTLTLKLLGKDGNEYRFRSINKDVTKVFPDELQKTFAQQIIQDQISASNPVAPILAYPLIKAVGILQAEPNLFIMPDDEALGEFRKQFAGMAGTLEIHPDENKKTDKAFAGALEVKGTYSLFEELDSDNDDMASAPDYLKARLMDIFINDWDRHVDQWRWAKFKRNNFNTWYPIPKDRDQAFARFDGLFPYLATVFIKKLAAFNKDYGNIDHLTYSGRYTDRRLLAPLDKSEWDSVTTFIISRLTDSVIINAVKRMPPEMFAKEGNNIIETLISRRDKLKEASDEFYHIVSDYVNVFGSEKHEHAEVTRLDDKRVEVKLYKKDGDSGKIEKEIFHRIFNCNETSEIRILLQGGDDDAVIRGKVNSSIKVIVSGGKGDNILIDSSYVQGSILGIIPDAENKTVFYTSGKNTEIVKGDGTCVYKEEFYNTGDDTIKYEPKLKNYGSELTWLPWLEINSDEGLLFGGGPVFFKYGYNAAPFVYRNELLLAYATLPKRFRVDLTTKAYNFPGELITNFNFKVTGLEVLNFFGFGNNSPYNENLSENDYYDIDQQQFVLTPYVDIPIGFTSRLSLGTSFKYVQTERKPNTFISELNPYGIEDIVLNNYFIGFTSDTRNGIIAPTEGHYLNITAMMYPGYLKNTSMFGRLRATARYYYDFNSEGNTSFAVRLGGEKLWGTFPFFEASYIGGQQTLRGFEKHRFSGDASIYSGAELRTYVTKFSFIIPVTMGFNLFAETGRVFQRHEHSNLWHSSYGAGLLFLLIKRDFTFNLSVAQSKEDTQFYLITGFAF